MHGLGKTEAQFTGLKGGHDIKLVSNLAIGQVPSAHSTPLFAPTLPQNPKHSPHLRLLLRSELLSWYE